MLELLQVQKKYGRNIILEIPALQLEKGIYWLKGANGSGKTTLLRMIAGLLPFRGDIIFNKASIKNNSLDYRRCVSWADAEPLFPDFITGKDIITLYRQIRKAPVSEMDTLISAFEMNEFLNNAVGTYSSGMMKKLSLVLAFLGSPPLIVLDEPLITLDADAVNTAFQLIREKHEHLGTTFLLSSHQDVETRSLLPNKELMVVDHKVYLAA